MNKTIKNYEIEKFFNTMDSNDNFMHNTKLKMPAKVRQAIRINFKTLSDRAELIQSSRTDIIKGYVDSGDAEVSDDGLKFKNHLKEAVKELNDLENVENTLDIQTIDNEALDAFLDKTELSMDEEDVLEFFREEKKEEKKDEPKTDEKAE